MSDLVKRLEARAQAIPQEVADRENECSSCCGAYGKDTWDDYSDNIDRMLMLECVTELSQSYGRIVELEAQVAALREAADGYYNHATCDLFEQMEKENALENALADSAATAEAHNAAISEEAYARGFHDAQEKAKVEGRLAVVDSPELETLRKQLEEKEKEICKLLGLESN